LGNGVPLNIDQQRNADVIPHTCPPIDPYMNLVTNPVSDPVHISYKSRYGFTHRD